MLKRIEVPQVYRCKTRWESPEGLILYQRGDWVLLELRARPRGQYEARILISSRDGRAPNGGKIVDWEEFQRHFQKYQPDESS